MTPTGVGTDVLARCERAIADFEELTRRLPADVDLWVDLANGHRLMCKFLWSVDRSRARQRRSFRKAVAIYERLARENPTVTNIRRLWAATLTGTTATRSSLFELKERLNYLKRGAELWRDLVAADSSVPRITVNLYGSLADYGFALWESGERSEGLRLLKESVEFMEEKDFSKTSYGDEYGSAIRLTSARNLAIALAFSGQAAEALAVVGRSLVAGEQIVSRGDGEGLQGVFAQNLVLHSYLAVGAGLKAEAARSVERAAAILEPLDLAPNDAWLLGGVHMVWYLQGRTAGQGRSAEPPGRPEHAAQAIALVRRAAQRGYVDVNLTLGFFGPVLGHLPEFRALMEDLEFPTDPFVPEPGSEDDETAADRPGPQP